MANLPSVITTPRSAPLGQELKELRKGLTEDVLSGRLSATEFPHRYVDVCDEWLQRLFAHATEGKARGLALVAVGGYGRKELSPGSDLDLVLIHRGRRRFEEAANTIWYAIWDSGIRLDHSVRTRKDMLTMARDDLKVILGLLDGRVIAGESELADPVFQGARDLWRRDWSRYLSELKSSVATRHRAAGELAFLLEPDLKLAAGGLRDLAVLHALGDALPDIAAIAHSSNIAEAERVLLAARVAVQCRTTSAGDRLLLQEQDQVAETLGYGDADRLMAAIAEAGRAVTTASDEGWRRVHLHLNPRDVSPSTETPLGSGVVWRGGEIGLAESANPATDPGLVFKVGLAAAERNALIGHVCLDRLERETSAPQEPWPDDLRHDFIALLQTGEALIPAIEALDQRRLFERFIPEWTPIRNKPQRNAYHRYTVDRHLLETIARAGEHFDMVTRPDLLVMAALLHDIGKGTPGADHSEVGTEIGGTVARRMGFNEKDVATLVKLISYHLVLPEFATRRDIDDPATATLVAKLVGDRETLDLLAALTEADGQATGTSAWGSWKSELVNTLVDRVASILRGDPIVPQPPFVPSPEQLALLERGELALLAQGRRVTVVAPDRTGLFACVTGALALVGCNVRRATAVEGIPGMALEIFDIELTSDRPIDWKQVERNVINAMSGDVPLSDRIRQRDNVYTHNRRPVSAHPTKTHVRFDNAASDRSSIIELRAVDRLGLLHDVTTAFAAARIDVVSALVDTLGHEVIDTFYVRDLEGKKLSDSTQIAGIAARLEEIIEDQNS